jgi:hypothetical protein
MTYRDIVEAIKKRVRVPSDGEANYNLPTSPKWTRIPYAVEIRRQPVPGTDLYDVRLVMTEFGEKPRTADFSPNERHVVEKICNAIARHLNGPRDLS